MSRFLNKSVDDSLKDKHDDLDIALEIKNMEQMKEEMKKQIIADMFGDEIIPKKIKNYELKIILLTERKLELSEIHTLRKYYNVCCWDFKRNGAVLGHINCELLVLNLKKKSHLAFWRANSNISKNVQVIYIYKGKTRKRNFEEMKKQYSTHFVKKRINSSVDDDVELFNLELFTDHIPELISCCGSCVSSFLD